MEPILTLGAIRQLCVVSSYLACAVARATESEAVAYAFESAAKGIEGAGEFRTKASPEVRRIVRRQIKRIEDSCETWLASELGADWQHNSDARAMLAALEHVLPGCLPGPDAFAAEDLDSSRITELALTHAVALDQKDLTFAKGGIGYNVLRSLLVGSIAALEHDAEFRELLQVSGLRELLRRGRNNEEAAERRQRELLEAIAREKGVDPKLLAPLFDHLGHSGLTPDEMRSRAGEAIEAILSRARQKVEPSNEGGDIDAAIGAARTRLGNLDTVGARAVLAEKIAEEETARRHRLMPLLEEQAAIEQLAYDYDAAKATLRKLIDLDPECAWKAWMELGHLLRLTGTLDQALNAVRQGFAIAERLTEEDTGNAELQHGLAAVHAHIGGIQQDQGNLPGAMTSYQASLGIRKRLAEADPGDADSQLGLATAHSRIGDMQQAQGNLPDALTSYETSLAIRMRLAEADPRNVGRYVASRCSTMPSRHVTSRS